jgi:hypothetical protein
VPPFHDDELATGRRQHAAQQGGAEFGEPLCRLPQSGMAGAGQSGPQAAEVPAPFRHQGAGHGQDQPEVLHQHRCIFYPLAEQGPQAHFQQRQGQHQAQCRCRQQGVRQAEAGRHAGRRLHLPLPVR